MRYKEFNTNSVLEKCINLFWRGGFGPCSVKEIVEETGVNRYSLYEEFDNKEGILEASMKLYVDRYAQDNINTLQQEGEIKTILTQFYRSFLKEDIKHPPGCYIIHVATELADHNTEIKEFLDQYLLVIENAFVELFKKNNYQPEEARFYSRHLITLFCYIMVFCVIRTPKEQNRVLSNEIDLILNKKLSHAA